MELTFLRDIAIVLGFSAAILLLFHRLHVPTIVGFLLTGVLIGPHGLALISRVAEVERLAEVGVVVLLFTIGIEFSLKSLTQIKKSVLVGGSLQVLFTFAAGFGVGIGVGLSFGQAVLIGFLVSLSSTAIVLKLLQERAALDSPHGRTTLGILIFQDIFVVVMMLVIPLLAGTSGGIATSLFNLLLKASLIIVFVFISARWLVPRLLYQVARTQNSELFLLSIVALGVTVVFLTSLSGLSIALGAFLAGLIISESEYSHHALGNMLPFRDIFMSFFFISVGMLLDIGFLFEQPGYVFLVAVGVLSLKAILAASATVLLGLPLTTAIAVGLALSQVGEFSFILAGSGVAYGLLPDDLYQLFLAVSVFTMAFAPIAVSISPRIADAVAQMPLPKRLQTGFFPVPQEVRPHLSDHLIIVGYGFNGRNLAKAANAASIPYCIIEINADLVLEGREAGERIYFGDATHEAVLERAAVKDARVAVVAISDPAATRRIIASIRRMNPSIYIVVRTRYIQEIEQLTKLGASKVIPEEFETSVEIFARVLKKYLIPKSEIERFVADIRSDGYDMLRSLEKKQASYSDFKLHLPEIEISTLRVGERSQAAGRTIADIALRKTYGITLLAIRRNTELLADVSGDTVIHPGDIVIIVGTAERLARAEPMFRDFEEPLLDDDA